MSRNEYMLEDAALTRFVKSGIALLTGLFMALAESEVGRIFFNTGQFFRH